MYFCYLKKKITILKKSRPIKRILHTIFSLSKMIERMPLYALSLLLLLPLCSRAQQEIVSSGGSGNGQGGTLEFSFGQVFDTYSQNEDNSVTEGV